MKIKDLLLEFEAMDLFRNVTVADIFGEKITAGQVADALPGVDPKTVVKYGKKINDIVQTNITPNYTVGSAIADIAVALPIGRALKGARTATQVTGALGGVAARRELGNQIAGNIKIMPQSTSGSSELVAPQMQQNKKKRKSVGEVVPVDVKGNKFNLPIVQVLPAGGYIVDASKVPGQQKGATITAPEPEDKI
jgi:hypothetical protein